MWTYKDKLVSEPDLPEDSVGFIYKIINETNGRIYVGKKLLAFTRKKKLTMKEKQLAENKRKTFKYVTTSSGWENYWGSCKELIQDVKDLGEDCFSKQILEFCFNKRDLTYREVWWQFKLEVLETNSYNANILSRFFKAKNK